MSNNGFNRKSRTKSRRLSDELAFRYGVRPWMIVAVLILVLVFAGVLYIVGRGSRLKLPAPTQLDLPNRAQ